MTTMIRPYYQRENHYNRGRDDIRRQLLNCLHGLGPTSITEILYRIALSHGQARTYLNDLIDSGLVKRRPLTEMIKELPKERLGKLANKSDNVTDLYTITNKGEKYLNKLNEMVMLITWDK
jgi:predicted transcriptional regulator